MLIDKSGRGQAFEENQQILVAYRVVIFWIRAMHQDVSRRRRINLPPTRFSAFTTL
jgi:hypothetical protein